MFNCSERNFALIGHNVYFRPRLSVTCKLSFSILSIDNLLKFSYLSGIGVFSRLFLFKDENNKLFALFAFLAKILSLLATLFGCLMFSEMVAWQHLCSSWLGLG